MPLECARCSVTIPVIQKRLKCTKCTKLYHNDCVGYSGENKPRTQWVANPLRSRFSSCTPISKTATTSLEATYSTKDIPLDLLNKIEDKVISSIRNELPAIIRDIYASELNEQLQALNESTVLLNNKYEELLKVVNTKSKEIAFLHTENNELKDTVLDLQNRLSKVEQFARQSNVEIVGVPQHRIENTNKIIEKICSVTGFNLSNRDSKKPRNLVCQFPNKFVRDNFLAAVINYNKTHKEKKLSSSLLGISGPVTPVYVNEHLTRTNKILHAETRKRAKSNGTKFQEVHKNVLTNNFMIIILTETWLNNNIFDSEIFDTRYEIYRRDRQSNSFYSNKDGGGALIA
ncbi:unnamed protein product [Leptidea sinapis]|uniref:Zinc finger PHD-type domain-containing protein n=1 Tax=Leptidea sinapis TaxID=189913 RepID=A0A5E4QJQ2_9NEOP|nr:unnamed protein product [Leptidea sinapis]